MKKILLTTLILFSIFKAEAQCSPIPYTGNSATITCSSPTVSIPLSTTVSPVTCVWDNNPGLVSGGNTLNPIVNYAGSYSFTLTNTNNGCITTGIANVSVNSVTPFVMINSSSYSICAGQTVTLTASSTGSVSYSWSPASSLNTTTNSSVTAIPNSNTVYTVTVTDLTSGCFATSSMFINVLSNPTITVNSPSVCTGTSATLVANGNGNYNWDNGATTNSITVTPTISTSYSVTTNNACGSAMTTATVTVDQTCQDVWPGDANSDGMANTLDVLELGLHFAQTGSPRATTSNSWQSYIANNWAGIVTNGKNLNHSDCNGDGIINNADTLAIYNNYGSIHAFKTTQTNTVNLQLSIVPDQSYLVKGTWGTASIYLGDNTNQLNTINGLAYTINFNNTLVETDSIYIEYLTSFLNSNNLNFSKRAFSNGVIYTATTHTNNSNVSGNGKIATLHYKINPSLTTDQILNIGLVQANKSDASGTITSLTSGSGTLIAKGTSVGIDEFISTNFVSVNPNPTNGILKIHSKKELQKIEVTSITSNTLLSEIPTSNDYILHLENFSNGIYFINIYQNDRIIKREKVIVNR